MKQSKTNFLVVPKVQLSPAPRLIGSIVLRISPSRRRKEEQEKRRSKKDAERETKTETETETEAEVEVEAEVEAEEVSRGVDLSCDP